MQEQPGRTTRRRRGKAREGARRREGNRAAAARQRIKRMKRMHSPKNHTAFAPSRRESATADSLLERAKAVWFLGLLAVRITSWNGRVNTTMKVNHEGIRRARREEDGEGERRYFAVAQSLAAYFRCFLSIESATAVQYRLDRSTSP